MATQQAVVVRLGADHGSLVNDEQRIGVLVPGTHTADIAMCVRHGGIDFLMDGERLLAGVARQHLGRTSGRGEEQCFDLQPRRRFDKCRHERCLARSGVPFEEECRMRVRVEKELHHLGTSLPLSSGRFMREEGEY